ncbi:MAG: hypothetical protein KDD60_09365, partial [Bdellovibrionales bacterium]|nr:hypothetical protein [Bdellovibrionales bacterium]
MRFLLIFILFCISISESLADEFSQLCPQGRIPGEFIVEFQRDVAPRSASERKQIVSKRVQKFGIAVKKFIDIDASDLVSVRTTTGGSDLEVFHALQKDSTVRSVFPNCLYSKFASGHTVAGKVVVPGFDAQDRPNITFATTESEFLVTIPSSLNGGTTDINPPSLG